MHTKEKTRLEWVDMAKFWGILAIVWGHTLSAGNVRLYLYSFHVPLFFFVIGLYFTMPQLSFWRFTLKKVISLLIPYFLFAVMSILLFSVLGEFVALELGQDVSGDSLIEALIEMLAGQCRANRPLWFLPCLFVFYLLCFLVAKFAHRKSERAKKCIAVSVMIGSILLCFLNEEYFEVPALFWKMDVSCFMLFFAAAAYVMKPILMRNMNGPTSFLIAIFMLLLGGAAAFVNRGVEYLYNSYRNVFLFYSSATCSSVGICLLSIALHRSKMKRCVNAMIFVGQRTFPILLMHKFPILFFQVIFPWTKPYMRANNPLIGCFVAGASIAMCLGADLAIKKVLAVFMCNKRKNTSDQMENASKEQAMLP